MDKGLLAKCKIPIKIGHSVFTLYVWWEVVIQSAFFLTGTAALETERMITILSDFMVAAVGD